MPASWMVIIPRHVSVSQSNKPALWDTSHSCLSPLIPPPKHQNWMTNQKVSHRVSAGVGSTSQLLSAPGSPADSWFWNPEGNAETEPDPGVNHSWASKMKGSLQLDTVLQGTRNTGNRHRNSYHQPFKGCLCNRPVCYGKVWAPQRKET